MAKTDIENVYVVSPKWMKNVVTGITNGHRPRVWYLNIFTRPELENLTTEGGIITKTTKSGRKVTVAAVHSVAPGSKHKVKVNGRQRNVTVPVREG